MNSLRAGDIIRKLMSPGPYRVLDSYTDEAGVNIVCQHIQGQDYQHFRGYIYTPCGRLVSRYGMRHRPGPLDEVFVIGHEVTQLALFEDEDPALEEVAR